MQKRFIALAHLLYNEYRATKSKWQRQPLFIYMKISIFI